MATVEYNQPTSAPTAKVAAVGKAGAIATLIPLVVTVLAAFGVLVPEDVSAQAVVLSGAVVTAYAAVQAIYQFVAGYITKSKRKV